MPYKCTDVGPHCPIDQSPYSYAPSLPPNAILLAFFSVSLLIHTIQGIYYRTWGLLVALVCGGLCEVIGYVGRLMMHKNAFSINGFLMQICTLSIGPAFYCAAIYLCLTRLVRTYGESISRLKPAQYTYIFICCDVVSLSLQGAGGGVASVDAQNQKSPTLGDNIMIAGLASQVFSLTLFAALAAEYGVRVSQAHARDVSEEKNMRGKRWMAKREARRLEAFLAAIGLAFLLIYIRCVYRIIELSGGWNSRLMKEETKFVILEGVMIVLAAFILNIFHPGRCLRVHNDVASSSEELNLPLSVKEHPAETKMKV